MADPNPGYRLVSILEEMLKQHGRTTRDAWVTVLGTATEEEFLWTLLSVQTLVSEVKHLVTICAPPHGRDSYTKWFKSVEHVVSVRQFPTNWDDTRGSLSPDTMEPLRFSAHLIQGMCFDSEIPADQLALLAQKVESLIAALEMGDLPVDLKRAITKKLVEIRMAIKMYAVVGNGGLREAWTNAVGIFAAYEHHLKDRWNHSSIKAFGEIILLVDFALSNAQNHHLLTWVSESVRQLL